MKFKQSKTLSRCFAASALISSAMLTGCGGGSSDNAIRPTKAMFDQIKIGMPYTQAASIVGKEGNTADRGFGSSTPPNIRRWSYGTTSDYADLIVCIPNGSTITFKVFSDSNSWKAGVKEGDESSCVF